MFLIWNDHGGGVRSEFEEYGPEKMRAGVRPCPASDWAAGMVGQIWVWPRLAAPTATSLHRIGAVSDTRLGRRTDASRTRGVCSGIAGWP